MQQRPWHRTERCVLYNNLSSSSSQDLHAKDALQLASFTALKMIQFSWVQIFTVLSFPSAPDAIMLFLGWHETDITVSVWPSNFWTIFLLCNSHKYKQWSSEPLTMYFPFVTEKVEEMQNFELLWPV